ncbi:MAG: DUF2378 family protein [Myxococcaceae bacterium]
MQPEPVVYRHTVEAFVNRVFVRRGLLTPEVVSKLRTLGLDPTRPRDMPVDPWRAVLKEASSLVLPGASEADAMRELGREMVRGFEASLVGRTLFIGLKLLGVKQTLRTIARNYRSADNATEVTTRELGERQFELTFTIRAGIPFPTYTEGVLEEGTKVIGQPGVKVVTTVLSPTTVTYVATW